MERGGRMRRCMEMEMESKSYGEPCASIKIQRMG
jgi:hypothetical protein